MSQVSARMSASVVKRIPLATYVKSIKLSSVELVPQFDFKHGYFVILRFVISRLRCISKFSMYEYIFRNLNRAKIMNIKKLGHQKLNMPVLLAFHNYENYINNTLLFYFSTTNDMFRYPYFFRHLIQKHPVYCVPECTYITKNLVNRYFSFPF